VRFRYGDSDLLVGDEVFHLQFGRLVDDDRAARIAVAVADVFELLDDNRAEFRFAGQDQFVFGDANANLAQFLKNFVDRELRQAIELQFKNGVDLLVGQAAFFTGQAFAIEIDDDLGALAPDEEILARFGTRGRSADDADNGVEIVEGDLEAL